jgi:transketolase
MTATTPTLRTLGVEIRRQIIERSKEANVGHIGSSLSIADILAALYGQVLRIDDLEAPDRDRFILSKGHAALALYVALHLTDHLTSEQLRSFCQPGGELTGHPEHSLAGVEFSTGSLGHGMAYGVGDALATRVSGGDHRTFVLVSDAECNEGSIWEAVMFSAQLSLSSLTTIVDANGQQALGKTKDVLDLEPLENRWRAFGWDVHTIDGHDPEGLAALLGGLSYDEGPPHAIIARTTFGSAVSYMESQIHWHYWPMSDEDYDRALSDLDDFASEVEG